MDSTEWSPKNGIWVGRRMQHRLGDPTLQTVPPNCFNLGDWVIAKIPEITLSCFNTSLTQFGRVPLMSLSASLTSRTIGQTNLHFTDHFHLWAHKGVSFSFQRKLKLLSPGSISGDPTFSFITTANRKQRYGATDMSQHSTLIGVKGKSHHSTWVYLCLNYSQVLGSHSRRKYRSLQQMGWGWVAGMKHTGTARAERRGRERGDLTRSENSESGAWEMARGKVLAVQAEGPGFNPQDLHKDGTGGVCL